MLVLCREIDQEIVIVAPDGTVIPIQVVAIRDSSRVRMGVRAPREYAVHRMEVWNEIVRGREMSETADVAGAIARVRSEKARFATAGR
jgi:carbon storage regulator CsrA